MKKERNIAGAKLLLKHGEYYLFSSLEELLYLTEREADSLRTNIMQSFWKGHFKIFSIPLEGIYFDISINGLYAEDLYMPIKLSKKAFSEFSPEFFMPCIADKEWEFYKTFNKYESTNISTFWFKVHFPLLAIALKDLRALLKSDEDLSPLLERLPLRKKYCRKKDVL